MKQYNGIKRKHPDAILLFRVGDFYETFGSDAIRAAGVLGITLTKRANGPGAFIELAGFPHHSIDTYLPKLIRAGHRVAICDQLEDPKKTKTIVKRGVTELVTPGVTFNENVLEQKLNNFLASLYMEGKKAGVAFLDISTAEFFVAEGSMEYVDKLVQSMNPSEILFQKSKKGKFVEMYRDKYYSFGIDDWAFQSDYCNDTLLKHFGTISLKGFGIEKLPFGIIAAGVAMHYLSETEHNKVQHIKKISRIEEDHHLWMDRFTIRNLELVFSTNENAPTLMDILDDTITAMGSRLLKRWIVMPLKDINPINERLDIVEYISYEQDFKDDLTQSIVQIGDLERLISKVAATRISPREVVQLSKSLRAIEPIIEICKKSKKPFLKRFAEQLNPCISLVERVEKEINEEPPALVNKGNVITNGVYGELDDLRKISRSGKDYLIEIQKREVEATGITSLKIGYNNVFGYYLEVTNAHKDKAPDTWIRKQTLTNAERYITEELKNYEEKILGAEEKILALETRLFNDLVYAMADYIIPVQLNASLVANLDCLLSFSNIAVRNRYVRPRINDSKKLDILEGRHPVIEKHLPLGQKYVSNNVYLDDEKQQIIIITGPNMSGKSALLRQTALIIIMAQIGCYVPADEANIGLVDKIFTRVGASDNIASGESTFMIEMNEAASILNNLSDRSLVLLDEIGRGTSTYDGISIAWAIAEYLHNQKSKRAKTLFATHYHELNELENTLPRVKNYNVAVKEVDGKVFFIRKLMVGGSEHSFGIHVAKLAGMPKKVVDRANEIMLQLEASRSSSDSKMANVEVKSIESNEDYQLSIFQLDDPVLSEVKRELDEIEIDNLTPVEALMKLNDIKKLMGK
ncbi:MAG: DNA mismatch repair protein MutS [Flavobacteriales bacterium]|nr:DNA mismatch repair protein MutS [Flavobacteriales bacterium]